MWEKEVYMNNREFFEKVIAANINEEITAFATTAIEKMDAENEKRRKRNAEKLVELEPVMEQIMELVSDDPTITADIAAHFDDMSTQKISSILRKMVEMGKISQIEVTITGKGKRKAYIR